MREYLLGFLTASTLFLAATVGFLFFCPEAKKMFTDKEENSIMLMIPQIMQMEPEQVAPQG